MTSRREVGTSKRVRVVWGSVGLPVDYTPFGSYLLRREKSSTSIKRKFYTLFLLFPLFLSPLYFTLPLLFTLRVHEPWSEVPSRPSVYCLHDSLPLYSPLPQVLLRVKTGLMGREVRVVGFRIGRKFWVVSTVEKVLRKRLEVYSERKRDSWTGVTRVLGTVKEGT